MMLIGHYCKQQYGQTLQNVSTAFQINFITHISTELFVYGAPAHTVFFLACESDTRINPFPRVLQPRWRLTET